MKNLDAPVNELFCVNCKCGVKPCRQIRLDALESGQNADCIAWVCSICECDNYTADDVSILDAEIVE
jgi:hypothetical protein